MNDPRRITTLVAALVLSLGMAVSAVGGGLHLGVGEWSPPLFWSLVLGGLPGALVGARLATVVPARALHVVLLVWLVYLGSQLFYRGVHAIVV